MNPETWIVLLSIILVVLIYIGIRPLVRSWPKEKIHMDIDEFGKWLYDKTGETNRFIEIMSGELPPQVYDPIAERLIGKPEIMVRVLTEKTVLCKDNRDHNKLVNDAFSGHARNIELRTLEILPKNHVKIFDRKLAWVEDPHPHGGSQPYREGIIVEDPTKVSVCITDFDWYWKRAVRERPICIRPQTATKG